MRAKALPKNAYLPVLLSARRVVVLESLPAPGGDNPDVLTRRGCRLGRAPWGIGEKVPGESRGLSARRSSHRQVAENRSQAGNDPKQR